MSKSQENKLKMGTPKSFFSFLRIFLGLGLIFLLLFRQAQVNLQSDSGLVLSIRPRYDLFIQQFPKRSYLLPSLKLLGLKRSSQYKLIVDTQEQKEYVYFQDKLLYVWPVSTGGNGYFTPKREWLVTEKLLTSANSEFGGYFLRLSNTSIGIHGTNQPEFIGQAVSHGCIRNLNDNAKWLYENIPVGTKVITH